MYELEDKDEVAAFYEPGSDRAVAVVCTAIVENRLTALLKAAMRDDAKVHEELFRPSGPVGSLSAKIKLAYLLGLMQEDLYRDLLLVTKIRNDFAHSVKITSFEDASVKGRVDSLHALQIWKDLEKKHKAELKTRPAAFDLKVQAQILGDDLATARDSFKLCLRLYIWKLVMTAKNITVFGLRPDPLGSKAKEQKNAQ